MINFCQFGAGRIGSIHAENIARHPGARLHVVVDTDRAAAERLAELYGAAVGSPAEALADPAVDAVVIASSSDTHADLVEAAARAGKAIFCEKPLDLDRRRAEACAAVAASCGVKLMVGFNRRFDPSFARLERQIRDGRIGKLEMLTITSRDPAPPPLEYVKVSGGLFRDMMIHDFDIACWIMGAMPDHVTAVGSSIVDPEIGKAGDVDTAVVTLHYGDGRIAVIKNSRRAAYGHDQRIEILGSDGLLAAGNVLESTVSKATSAGVVSAKPEYFFLERYMRAYAAEWAGFVEAVTKKSSLPVTLADGVNALAIAEAATRSAKSKSTVDMASVLS
jgi:myo-inositol 2-dehydrogenase/D-chiro-inositol 1-dehydrogenase